jgi:phosphatidylserine decarboxylase
MKLHREGTGILTKLLAILIVANGALYFTNAPRNMVALSAIASTIIFLLVLNFFRLPFRHFSGDDANKIVAPADGKIVAIEETVENEYFKDKRLQVSIFMSVFNVHANWYPASGKVAVSKHHNGRFMAAYLPKSSTENERSTVVITLPDGREILTRQIAGAMARRIVTYAKPEQDITVNDQMGFIKFGSRVDIFLPLDSEILVELDQKVTATQTILANLVPSNKQANEEARS